MNFELNRDGFEIVPDIFSESEIDQILTEISLLDTSNPQFRKSADLFAVRRFFQEAPGIADIVLQSCLARLTGSYFSNPHFVVKSIYFDKPAASNWFVAFHQDLSISVRSRAEVPGFSHWTVKHDQFGVQPTLEILENIVTVRVHLDETTAENGALRVMPGSHRHGIIRPEGSELLETMSVFCEVPKGGAMLMKPLLLHASGRTINQRQRRVIHIEFASIALPEPLKWAERHNLEAIISGDQVPD